MAKKVETEGGTTTHFTKEEITMLYQLSQSATIVVKDMQVVAQLLNKCLDYINQK